MDEFWIFKIVNIFLASLFMLGAWGVRKIVGVWLNPASIFLLFWCFYTAFPILVAFDAPVNPFAIAYILAFCYVFALPCFLFRWKTALVRNERKLEAKHYFGRPLMITALYVLSGFAMLLILFGFLEQGFTAREVLDDPLAAGGAYAAMRYSGELERNISSQLGLQFCYYAAVLGGLVYGAHDPSKNRTWVVMLVFVPSLLIMFLQNSKGLFFISVFLFFGGVLVTRIYNKNFTLFSYADIRKLSIYGALAIPVVIASFLSRGIYQLDDIAQMLIRLRFYLVSYSSGHLSAFSDWFSNRYFFRSLMNYEQDVFTMGFYTFMALFKLAGDDRYVPMGVYEEYFTYGEVVKSNIYTVFRGLISDFTLPGSLVFAFISGWICNLVFWRFLCRRGSAFGVVFLVYFVAIGYQSYIISSLTWLTIPFTFFVMWLMLFFLMKAKVQ